MFFKRLVLLPKLLKTSSICLNQENNYLAVSVLNNKLRLKQTSFKNQLIRHQTTGQSESPNLNQEKTEEDNESDESVESIILKNSLKFVPEYGFTTEAISRGAKEIGLSSASKGIFSNGAFDLIDYFYKQSNKNLEQYLENLVKEGKVTKKNDLIRSAIVYRLSLIQPYIKHWPQAMAIQTFNPFNAVVAIENLLRLCDQIWHQVGDNSTDVSVKKLNI